MKIKLTEEQYISIIKEQNVGMKKIINILSSTPKISVPNINASKKIKLNVILKSNNIGYMKNQLSSLYKNVGTDNLNLKNMLLQANIKPRDVGGIIEQINIAEKYILLALHRGMKAEDLALKLGTGWSKQDVKKMVDIVYGKNIVIYDKLGIFKDKLTTRTDAPQSFFGKTKKDVLDHYRFKKFTDLEKKIFNYIKGYDKIDKRLKPYIKSFRKYYGDHISGKRVVDEKLLTDEEILKFLTKHYYDDVLPNLSGLYKNRILAHGSKDMKNLNVIDISTHLGKNTHNKGLLGDGFYLTAHPKTGEHYGDIQPFVINKVSKPLNLKGKHKNPLGWHDYRSIRTIMFNDIDKLENILDAPNLKKLKEYPYKRPHKDSKGVLTDRPFFQVAEAVPELDAAWKQNSIKILKKEFRHHLKEAGLDPLSVNKVINTLQIKHEPIHPAEFANIGGENKMMNDLMKREKYDLIVSSMNTGHMDYGTSGPSRFMDAEVIVKQDKANDLISIFPSVDLIKNMEGNSISRNIGSKNIHLESTGRQIKLLVEQPWSKRIANSIINPKIKTVAITNFKKIKKNNLTTLVTALKNPNKDIMLSQLKILYKNVGNNNDVLKQVLKDSPSISNKDISFMVEQLNLGEKYILLALHRGMSADEIASKIGKGWTKNDIENIVNIIYGNNSTIKSKLKLVDDIVLSSEEKLLDFYRLWRSNKDSYIKQSSSQKAYNKLLDDVKLYRKTKGKEGISIEDAKKELENPTFKREFKSVSTYNFKISDESLKKFKNNIKKIDDWGGEDIKWDRFDRETGGYQPKYQQIMTVTDIGGVGEGGKKIKVIMDDAYYNEAIKHLSDMSDSYGVHLPNGVIIINGKLLKKHLGVDISTEDIERSILTILHHEVRHAVDLSTISNKLNKRYATPGGPKLVDDKYHFIWGKYNGGEGKFSVTESVEKAWKFLENDFGKQKVERVKNMLNKKENNYLIYIGEDAYLTQLKASSEDIAKHYQQRLSPEEFEEWSKISFKHNKILADNKNEMKRIGEVVEATNILRYHTHHKELVANWSALSNTMKNIPDVGKLKYVDKNGKPTKIVLDKITGVPNKLDPNWADIMALRKIRDEFFIQGKSYDEIRNTLRKMKADGLVDKIPFDNYPFLGSWLDVMKDLKIVDPQAYRQYVKKFTKQVDDFDPLKNESKKYKKIKLNESQYKKILLREFGETVTDPKEWYRRVLEWVDSPNDLDFEANQYEVVAYDDKGAYLGYYDKGQGFGFVVTEYGIGLEDEEEIIDEDEEGGTTSSGGSMTKWEDLVSPVRGPDNTLDNSPWDVSPVRGPDNTLDNSPWDVSPVRGPDNQLT